MNNISESTKAKAFERFFVGFMAMSAGLLLIYLALLGPLFLGIIKYRTAEAIISQLIGQDIVNLFLLSPLLILGGLALILKKSYALYLLIFTPLFLIYYSLSYSIGWEWSSPLYFGNNEKYILFFIFILIASMIILLYSLAFFPLSPIPRLKRKGLIIYSFIFSLFLSIFAVMWLKEVTDVMIRGTARGYELAPTAFWVVRVFDLGFSIPLGFISLYLLWTRPQKAFPLICLFYGFFITQIVAVNAMSWAMFFKKDPTFLWRDLIVFSLLAIIIFFGFFYLLRSYRPIKKA